MKEEVVIMNSKPPGTRNPQRPASLLSVGAGISLKQEQCVGHVSVPMYKSANPAG